MLAWSGRPARSTGVSACGEEILDGRPSAARGREGGGVIVSDDDVLAQEIGQLAVALGEVTRRRDSEQ